MILKKTVLLLILLVKIHYATSQTVFSDTTCIKTESLRRLVIDARKSKIQTAQIEILNKIVLNDSIIMRVDSVTISNQAAQIEENRRTIAKERLKVRLWQGVSGLLGLIAVKMALK